ncbi:MULTISPECIES: histidine kinase dimerization/phospho-acceptor domain-containing protein [Cellvibrio]|jgi:signal transduction histidine kinase|uniref:histidine kinase n=1 Tax=Cellvibrio fibrivorans TaxID=126350 RepID=A0ABU1UYN0_9GAMM|nr:histidine kinase dimerization/phospho-acceptor domain-containing protein [Cellvibrio fibrivorans]MDR7090275.1 signal transduction histidine kinase [Cellvibrio fibrivorans]
MDGEKNRFVHDLRNPLNTISINAELGKLTLERTGDIRKAISIFETILTECQQCSQVLETLHNTRFTRALDSSSEGGET